jgi:hypothetical protein
MERKIQLRSPLLLSTGLLVALLLPGVSHAQDAKPKTFVELGREAQGIDPYKHLGGSSPSSAEFATRPESFVELGLAAQGIDRARNIGGSSSPSAQQSDEPVTFVERALVAQGLKAPHEGQVGTSASQASNRNTAPAASSIAGLYSER